MNKMLILFILFMFFIVVGSLIIICSYLNINENKNEDYDVVVLLGCKIESYCFKSRICKVMEIYRKNKRINIIVTGKGNGIVTEAEWVKNELLKLGVLEDKIVVERLARNTSENLIFSKRIIKDRDYKKVLIVSSSFHIARIKMILWAIDLKADVTCKKMKKIDYTFKEFFRELLAYIKDFLLIIKYKKMKV